MLLIVEKGIIGGLYHFIDRYAKANNKYIKDYEEKKEKMKNRHVQNIGA